MSSKSVLRKSNKFLTEDEDLSYLTFVNHKNSMFCHRHSALGNRKMLHDKKLESKHGSGVVNRLSYDLKQRYPQMGVSPRNLWDMKKFYERFYESEPKLRQAVAVLPWGHTLTLMRKFGYANAQKKEWTIGQQLRADTTCHTGDVCQ